ncbi:3'-5' exonuclease [Priestia flexa]|uniref:3'-5' exonuclease n=1 Tax=Priestia flexa TaxID=86664 RepID=UPI003FCF3EC4
MISHLFDDSLKESGTSVILHVETNDLHDPKCVQITVISADTKQILFDSLVQCKEYISPVATQIHKLSKDDLQNAPLPSEIFNDFFSVIENKNVIVFNADFTTQSLFNTFNSFELISKLHQEHFYCLMYIYCDIHRRKSVKLSDISHEKVTGEKDVAYQGCVAVSHVLDQLIIQQMFAPK